MGRINGAKVIWGGLLAGVVVNLLEYVLQGIILQADWAAASQALGKSAVSNSKFMTLVLLWGFVVGISAVWLYAAIRPRYGAGPKTAMTAGFAVWIMAYLLPSLIYMAFELWPPKLIWIPLIEGLPEAVIATLIGAAPYSES